MSDFCVEYGMLPPCPKEPINDVNSAEVWGGRSPIRGIIVGGPYEGKSRLCCQIYDDNPEGMFYLDKECAEYWTDREHPEEIPMCERKSYFRDSVKRLKGPLPGETANDMDHKLYIFDDIPREMVNSIKSYYKCGRHSNASVVSVYHSITEVQPVIAECATFWGLTQSAVSSLHLRSVSNRLGLDIKKMALIMKEEEDFRYLICYIDRMGKKTVKLLWDNNED